MVSSTWFLQVEGRWCIKCIVTVFIVVDDNLLLYTTVHSIFRNLVLLVEVYTHNEMNWFETQRK